MEVIFELLAEFIFQALGEALIELGFHALAEPFRKPVNPWLAAFGYTLFGAIFGGLSLLIFPMHFISIGSFRIANLILTPVAVGFCMVLMGKWRSRRGDPLFGIDKFAYGYLFALSLALIRYFYAK